MTKKLILLFASYFFILSFVLAQTGASSYADYYESKFNELSFEGKAYHHEDEGKSINNYLVNVATPSREVDEEYYELALSFLPQLLWQKWDMDQLGLDCESLRLCDSKISEMSISDQEEYLDNLTYLTDNYALTGEEVDEINLVLDEFLGLMSAELSADVALLKYYLEKAKCLRYTKVEMLRDFTGYCSPLAFKLDHLGPYTRSGKDNNPLSFEREKQGLAITEAIRRLVDLETCSCSYLTNYWNEGHRGVGSLEADEYLSVLPNPFYKLTTINFQVENETKVDLSIYDVSGKKVKGIYQGMLAEGLHQFSWDATNENNERVTEGIYFCRVLSKDVERVLKLVVANTN